MRVYLCLANQIIQKKKMYADYMQNNKQRRYIQITVSCCCCDLFFHSDTQNKAQNNFNQDLVVVDFHMAVWKREIKIICDCLQQLNSSCFCAALRCADNFRVVQWTFNVRMRACAHIHRLFLCLLVGLLLLESLKHALMIFFTIILCFLCVHSTDNRWILDDIAPLFVVFFFCVAFTLNIIAF